MYLSKHLLSHYFAWAMSLLKLRKAVPGSREYSRDESPSEFSSSFH